MREINIEIIGDELKNKLGIKDVDLTPIIDGLNNVKSAIDSKKFDKGDTKNLEKLLKIISDKKQDNSDVIKAINDLVAILNIEKEEKDYSDKFDALIEATTNLPQLFRPAYNPHDTKLKNSEDAVINPATEEKQDTQIDNQEIIIDSINTIEPLLADIKDNQTNLTQKTQIFDSWGDHIGATLIDEIMSSSKIRICGGVFNGSTPDTNFYTTVINANGTSNITNRIIDLATTTDSGSSVMVYTNAIGRFIGGSQNHLFGIFRPGDTGVANNTRQVGVTALADLANSFYFQLSGTTFSIVANTAGLDQIKIDNGSFNGEEATYPITDTFHAWEIIFTNKDIVFYIDKHLIHTLTETTFPICGTRHLRPFIRNANTGVGSVTHLYASTLELLTWGETHTQSKSWYHEGTTAGTLLKVGIGSMHSLVISGVVNNANVDIYNGTSAAGIKVWSSGAMSNQTVPLTIIFNTGDLFTDGLFVVKNGANCNTKLFYE